MARYHNLVKLLSRWPLKVGMLLHAVIRPRAAGGPALGSLMHKAGSPNAVTGSNDALLQIQQSGS